MQQPQTTARAQPSLGAEKPVALRQPARDEQFDPVRLSRREQARFRRHQRREERMQRHEERAQRREERRNQISERQQEQVRHEDVKARSGRLRLQPADDERDADDRPTVVVPREGVFDAPPLFGGLFGSGR
jgi:hypothetical protein